MLYLPRRFHILKYKNLSGGSMFIYNVKINGGIALKTIIVILSIFMLIVFGISVYRIFFKSGRFEINDMFSGDEITEIQPENYTNILKAVHDDLDSYVGLKIKITGYVYRLIDFQEDEFVLARDMFINEEGTQSVVVGFLSQYKDANKLKDGEWVEIIGVIEKGKYHNEDVPILKITELKQVSDPENAFVLPPNDTYIPTSGIL